MVFDKKIRDEPLKLPSLKGLRWNKPKKNSLESEFSELDLSFSPSPSPSLLQSSGHQECFSCKLPIFHLPEVLIHSKRWHAECFQCIYCSTILNPERFWEQNGKFYCEADYNNLFLAKCYSCTKTIFEIPVKFLQRTYHPLCFTCRKCSEVVCPYNFKEKYGSPYCEEDFHKLFSPKCYTCNLPIRDEKQMTKALGQNFHPEHFVCYMCAKPLPQNNFRQKEGEVYCEDDYHKLFSPRCAYCDEPIRHNGLIALGKKWHRDCCLRCGSCNKVLKEDNYIQVNDKAYCHKDWRLLFAPKCWTCKNPVSQVLSGESVVALGRDYHPECFICKDCNGELDERSFYEWEGEPYCYEHYHYHTCTDCVKVREEKLKSAMKIIGDPKAARKTTRRSITPVSFLFRSKSTPP